MRKNDAKDVDAYIGDSAVEARPIMEELRKIIKATVPEVEEGISWGVPFYKFYGMLGGFSVFQKHVSFGLAFTLPADDREALERKGYKTGKKTVQIGFDQKVPAAAIKKLLKTRAKENKAKKGKK